MHARSQQIDRIAGSRRVVRCRRPALAAAFAAALAAALAAAFAASLLAAVLASAAPAGELAAADPESTPPATAGPALADRRVPPVDPFPYQALVRARRQLRSGKLHQAESTLASVRAAQPGFLPAILAAARLDAHLAPRRLVQHFDAAVRAARSSFALQALALSRGGWWLIGSALLALTILAAARALTVTAPLHHVLFERLSPATDARFAGVAAATLLALPFIWGLGPLAACLVLVALGARQMLRGDRLLLGAGLLALVAIGVSAQLGPPLRLPDFRDPAMVLATAQRGRLTPAVEARLLELRDAFPAADLVRALALRHSDRCAEAERLLEAYLRQHPDDPTARIALGNCLVDRGLAAAASRQYQAALSLAPRSVEATYNQALALAGMLRFEASKRLLARATAIDFAAVRAARAGGGDGAAVVEPTLPPARLWRLHLAGQGGPSRSGALRSLLAGWPGPGRAAPPPSAVRLLLPWRGGTLWPLGVLGVGLALALRPALWRRLRTFECSICGRTVCRRCVRRARSRIFCQPCAAAVDGIPSSELVHVLAAGRRRRLARRPQRWDLALSLLVPGYGLMRHDRPGVATLTALLVAAGVMGIAIPHSLPGVLPAPQVYSQSLGDLLAAAVALAGGALAVGLGITLKGRDLERGVRGQLVPLAGPARDLEFRTGTDG